MENLLFDNISEGRIACCECGVPIPPNPMNMCLACIRSRVDITEGIPKQGQLQSCRNCSRYLVPPNTWVYAELESKELLSVCIGRMKSFMQKVRLVNAAFIWTEPHSKRVRLNLTIQKEVFTKAILQQSFAVEFTILNLICDECRRFEAKDYWRACVQVRQRCDYKKTLFYLEQLLLKHSVHQHTNSIKSVTTGIDFFYQRQQDAKKLVDLICSLLPSKTHHSQQLVTHDVHNNFYDYKHTFCVEIVPVTKDGLICLPKELAQQFANIGQFVVCLRVTDIVTLINPRTLQTFEVNSTIYWKHPFEMLAHPKNLVEYYVVNTEEIYSPSTLLPKGHGNVSKKHKLVDAWIVRSSEVGLSEAKAICTRTHLGHILNPGDLVLGYNLWQSNTNSTIFDAVREDHIPDVVLVRKVYDRANRIRKRDWKLKRLCSSADLASTETEFDAFLDDIEEDRIMREKINIYKKDSVEAKVDGTESTMEEDIEERATLEEMLNDLEIDEHTGT